MDVCTLCRKNNLFIGENYITHNNNWFICKLYVDRSQHNLGCRTFDQIISNSQHNHVYGHVRVYIIQPVYKLLTT